ncbi:MAG: response regulator, partial [Thermodesulfobacteriota bacterium]
MKKSILFVDDEPNILKGLQRMLRSMRREWDMRFAESGPEALEIMEQEPFDVLVSDMRMPGMDGVQLLEEVRKKYPETVRIVLSGHSDSQMTMKAVRVAHQYISKPAEAEELKSKISRSCSLLSLLNSAPLVKVVSGLERLPTLPQVYQQVMEELQQEEPSIGKVGAVIAKAPTMA